MKIHKSLHNQRGDGIAIIIYGISLILLFTFAAINVANGKIIENGYNSLRDAVQSASTGSVIHLLTTVNTSATTSGQADSLGIEKNEQKTQVVVANNYDIYLQLALGYVINRPTIKNNEDGSVTEVKQTGNVVESGAVNNFIKLDHKKVVNSTLALLDDSVIKRAGRSIHDTSRYKILMFFIEPNYDSNYKKSFNVIVYGNAEGDYDTGVVLPPVIANDDLSAYNQLQSRINDVVNNGQNDMKGNYAIGNNSNRTKRTKFNINLVTNGLPKAEMVREMETKPYYLIVVKDFALPTIFGDKDTDESGELFESGFDLKKIFTGISGDGHLKTPMCALNSGKVERKLKGIKR